LGRYHCVKAIINGRAVILNPYDFSTSNKLEDILKPFEIIVYHQVAAVPEVKLLGDGSRSILRRDDYKCQYIDETTGLQCTRTGNTLDHLIPSSRGGSSTWKNLVACCRIHNQKKGNKTVEEAGLILVRLPMSPRAHLYDKFQQIIDKARAKVMVKVEQG
jgi:hypothetical protein